MPKRQANGIPVSYEQQQEIRKQRQRIMNKKQDQMAYAQGSGDAAAAAKKQSEAVDYSKARSGGYSGPSLDMLNQMLERAKASGSANRIKGIEDQIRIAKKQGAK
jgi:hypothetical protein